MSAMPVIRTADDTVRLTALIRDIRASVAAYPGDWQDVADALRPRLPLLWEQLQPEDKRLFLGRLARYWKAHRHHRA